MQQVMRSALAVSVRWFRSEYRWISTLALAFGGVFAMAGCNAREESPVGASAPPEPIAAADQPHRTSADGETSTGKTPAPAWTPESFQAALKAKNPDYDGQGQLRIQNGRVVAADLSRTAVVDLSPLAGEPVQALDLSLTPVEDLSPLRGAPLTQLYLEQTRVTDLSPLKGMPLVELYLSRTGVSDLSPLKGAPLDTLNLLGTPVRDLSPLAGMPLRMLWLNETPMEDISPLRGLPLESLTLHRTQVRDLSPLAGSGLRRLHIGETPVTDLTPLRGMHLTRLIFDPRKITRGLEVVWEMRSLQELGLTFDERMPPEAFWAMFPELARP